MDIADELRRRFAEYDEVPESILGGDQSALKVYARPPAKDHLWGYAPLWHSRRPDLLRRLPVQSLDQDER